jgi:cation:H+ antiporter
LTVGAELLVRGASGLARAFGLPSLLIGLTVVAYGTSAPEFAVSMKAGLSGQADIALGNVVGSNIFNVLLILGVSALVMPLSVSSQLIRLDVPVMIGVSALMWLFAADGMVSRWEGLIMAFGLAAYTVLLLRLGIKSSRTSEHSSAKDEAQKPKKRLAVSMLLVACGLGLLVLGARWLVAGTVVIAKALGVGELMIGLTIVAAGTSLPELATSVVAAIRGERDLAVGNVVGSNIFNILAVLGTSAAISGKVGVSPGALSFDIPVMTAVALACLPIFFTGGRISRWEGALFVAYYVAYVFYLILSALRHEALGTFGTMMLWLVIPATALGIGSSLIYASRARKETRR